MPKLTVAQGTALSAGAVLGTGIISMPALAAAIAGPASLVAWLALVLLSAPLAWTFGELGARFPDGGGVSAYVRRAFGTRAADAVGWIFYFAVPFGAPVASFGAGRPNRTVTGAGTPPSSGRTFRDRKTRSWKLAWATSATNAMTRSSPSVSINSFT